MMRLSKEKFMMWLEIHLLTLQSWKETICFCELGDSRLVANRSPPLFARNDVIVIEDFMMWAADTSPLETRKLEVKLDALMNLVAHLSQIEACLSLQEFAASVIPMTTILAFVLLRTNLDARNDAIVIRGVHDMATDTSDETRQLQVKLNTLVNLVTQLAANQKPASVGRVCGIRSYNDHHTSVCPSSQQSGVDEHPEAYDGNTYSRPPQQGVHDVATDTFVETRKLEGRLDALVNLVTQLAANQKPASVARVCGIRSSNDHHTSVCPSSRQSRVDEHPEAYAANTYSRPPQRQRQGT
ncbi:hypothetical protein Fmac_028735 [Flemingia macrophylla]|uniref:Uncharacterized protein n=1 Tax=Flemingia macrophylla TaxID=520843 RepID=A0ABD1L8C5_9FABA